MSYPLHLVGAIANMSLDGTSGIILGRTFFVAPFAGRITAITMSPAAAPSVDTNFHMRTKSGLTASMGVLPSSLPGGVFAGFKLDVDPNLAGNFVEAGEAFSVESDGAGTTAGRIVLVVQLWSL